MVYKYFLTFGFKIKISSYMKAMGYTLQKFCEERNLINDGEEESLIYCFLTNHLSHWEGFKFNLEGLDFIERQLSENEKDSDKYLVVGVDLGVIENSQGKLEKNEVDSKQAIKTLVKQDMWIKLILESESANTHSQTQVEYGIKCPPIGWSIKPWYIIPNTYIITDDCSCCS